MRNFVVPAARRVPGGTTPRGAFRRPLRPVPVREEVIVEGTSPMTVRPAAAEQHGSSVPAADGDGLPVICTLDAHKHLGTDKGVSTVVGTPGTLSHLAGRPRVGARPVAECARRR